MRRLLMMQGARSGWEATATWPPGDVRAHIGFMMTIAKDLTESCKLVLAEGLDIHMNARIVTARRVDVPTVAAGGTPSTPERHHLLAQAARLRALVP